jgi:hypothetical protein
MKRLVALLPVLIALQAGVPPALAWTWPVDGPVLRPFVFGDDPYAAGQHRGMDIGAPPGQSVRAPAAGTVAFAGTVPHGGRTVTIETADGYSVTLLHLGSVAATRGRYVGEGDVVGTVGPSGEPELAEPYVHLGVRRTVEEHGYLDPLALLPARAGEPPRPSEPAGPEPPGEAPVDEPVEATPPAQPPASEQPQGSTVGARPSSDARAGAGAGRASPPERRARRPGPVTPAASAPGSAAGGLARIEAGRLGSVHPEGSVLPARRAPSERTAPPPGKTMPHARAHALGGPVGYAGASAAVLATLLVLAASAGLAVRRRQLGDAAAADGAATVLLHRAGLAAEDARRPRPAEQDRLVFDGDLERILLAESEPLADLDRDDDPAELVDVADDPRPRHSSRCARPRTHRNRFPRSPHYRAGLPSAH